MEASDRVCIPQQIFDRMPVGRYQLTVELTKTGPRTFLLGSDSLLPVQTSVWKPFLDHSFFIVLFVVVIGLVVFYVRRGSEVVTIPEDDSDDEVR
jgi:hypothetical protein